MKNKFLLIISLAAMMLSACGGEQNNEEGSNINMANPASVYCLDQGYQLEMREDANGTYGVCIFPDGSECEEWAYFRGECESGGSIQEKESSFEPFSMPVAAIYGSVVSSGIDLPASSKLVLTQEGLGSIYITGENEEFESKILALRDKQMPSNKANFWGLLDCPMQDECLLTVSQMREDGPGEFPPADQLEAWEGVVFNGPPGPRSGGDDYFVLLGPIPFQYGIDGADDTIRQQIESLRDSGQAIRIWGQLFAGRMDWNGAQIVVSRIELIDIDPAQIPDSPDW